MSIAVNLVLKGKQVYIIGGGKVAYRKACAYLQEGAIITIIALEVIKELRDIDELHILIQPFSWDQVTKAYLLYVATNDEGLNSTIVQEAQKRGILCGCATRCDNVGFTSMKQEEFSHLQVAIASKQSFPYASTVFLKQLTPQLQRMNDKVAILQSLREHLLVHKEDSTIWDEVMKLANTTLTILTTALYEHKQIIILAYHGVANIATVAQDMEEMRNLCNTSFPNHLALDAFLSDKIIQKAKKKGFFIDSLESIVKICDNLGIAYVIQPMLLSNGAFMKKIQSTYFDKALGSVLCESSEDVQEIVSELRKQIGKPLCLSYHHSESNIATFLNAQKDIYAFPYEASLPSFQTSYIHLQAFAICTGYHAQKDIVNMWLPALQKRGINVQYHKEGLLSYSFVRAMFLRRIQCICDHSLKTTHMNKLESL